MGNCIRKKSSMQWGGEDWSSFNDNHTSRENEGLLLQEKNEFLSSALGAPGTSEVKIKISKKQLEQMLKNDEFQGLSVQEILAELMNVGDRFEVHQRSWRPELQSIPE